MVFLQKIWYKTAITNDFAILYKPFWINKFEFLTWTGVFVAFPVAYSLYKKGAALGVIFTYIGASAVCRIPMNLFELSFMGIKFTAIRLAVSLPLVILSSILLGRYLKKQNYEISNG